MASVRSVRGKFDCLRRKAQEPSGILPVDLMEHLFRQPNAINTPTSLRRDGRRDVVEVLVIGFEEPVIDLVQVIAEELLGRTSLDYSRDSGMSLPVSA
jgi:hypothetical protein